MSKEQRTAGHDRRKVESFEHKPTYLVVTFQGGELIRHVWNDSIRTQKLLYRDRPNLPIKSVE
jgi:hypothetical protein